MVTIKDLRDITQEYLDKLEYTHPFVNSDKFVDNSYAKWACKEILNVIDKSNDLPFKLTPIELLDAFSNKMQTYALMNSKNALCFTIGQETAEYLIEECWLSEWRKSGRRKH